MRPITRNWQAIGTYRQRFLFDGTGQEIREADGALACHNPVGLAPCTLQRLRIRQGQMPFAVASFLKLLPNVPCDLLRAGAELSKLIPVRTDLDQFVRPACEFPGTLPVDFGSQRRHILDRACACLRSHLVAAERWQVCSADPVSGSRSLGVLSRPTISARERFRNGRLNSEFFQDRKTWPLANY